MERTIFDSFPLIDSDQPLVSDQFYAWLKDAETFKPANQRITRHNDFFESLDLYLSGYGWDIKKHKLSESSLKTLEYVFDIYQNMFTPIRDMPLHSLLRVTDDKEKGFWLYGKDERYKPTALLRDGLNNLGLVYDVEPKHYYFQIINGYLFIKYQTIIGSRRLCKLKGDI